MASPKAEQNKKHESPDPDVSSSKLTKTLDQMCHLQQSRKTWKQNKKSKNKKTKQNGNKTKKIQKTKQKKFKNIFRKKIQKHLPKKKTASPPPVLLFVSYDLFQIGATH